MAEKETVFSSKTKYNGVLSFKDFYQFCYDWLTDEFGLFVIEKKYAEKIDGNVKSIDIEWEGVDKVTDYFKFSVKVVYKIRGLEKVEITQNGNKIKADKGAVEIAVKGTLVRDYDGKFEKGAIRKFLRAIYEKWVIPARVEQFEDKLIGDCDEFLAQAKAYLDLEGKR